MTSLSNFFTRSMTVAASTPRPDRRPTRHLVQQALSRHGYNSTSYMALESDKQHFTHTRVDGATAYAQKGRIAIAAGEPICALADLPAAIDEFSLFSYNRNLQPLFFEVSEQALPALAARGFKFLKTGEEPFFELDRFSLKGNKMLNVRSSGNTAKKRGVTVREYFPAELSSQTASINAQLEAISASWVQGKGVGELTFTLGGLSLKDPADRRYFIAEQANLEDPSQPSQVVAFVTYTPIYARNGMYLDLMRRQNKPPTGTMDLLLTESWRMLKESGVARVTMGMAPLANVQNTEVPQSPRLAWALQQVYEKGHKIYHFKQLRDFKQKFQPHAWESKYLAYRHLGYAELDAIIQAVQGQSIGSMAWDALNQPIF
jgi:phosphatidylglycerol lysyltransferase